MIGIGIGIGLSGMVNHALSMPAQAIAEIVFSDVPDGAYGQAAGWIRLDVQPTAGHVFRVNTVSFIFTAGSSPASNEIQIGSARAQTAANIQARLAASVNPLLTVATYAVNELDPTQVNILYNTFSSEGNSFVLEELLGRISVSGATLTGGGGNFIIAGTLVITCWDEVGGGGTPPDPYLRTSRLSSAVDAAGAVADIINNPLYSTDAQCSATPTDGNVELIALETGAAGNSIPLSTTATNTTVTPFSGGSD